MIESVIARRYAKALFEIGIEEKQEQLFLEKLEAFYGLYKEYPPLLSNLSNRFMNLNSRLNIVDLLSQKIKAPKVFADFLKLLIKKGRISLLKNILGVYRRFVHEYNNQVQADVISAKPLKEAKYKEIIKILSEETGKEVLIEKKVDAQVLGGICIVVAGKVYNGTVKNDLDQLSNKMIYSV